MRTLLLPLLLAACAPAGEIDPFSPASPAFEDVLADAEGSDVSLRAPLGLQVGAIAPGQSFTVDVSGLAPGETAYLGYSLNGVGQGPCPPAMGGQCLDMVPPVTALGTQLADQGGVAHFRFVAPAQAQPGLRVTFQAVAIRGPGGSQTVKSPALTQTVGSPPTTDQFRNVPASVDLLFVVDNSCSMADEQAELMTSFTHMLGMVGPWGLSMHVGVVTTDMADASQSGRLQPDASGHRYLDDTVANPVQSFMEMADVGTTGSGTEQGLAAFEASLDPQLQVNAGFRRADAQYVVVVLSDENDFSRVSTQSAIDTMMNEESYPGDSSFNSIVTTAGYSPSTRYLVVTDGVGGIVEDIGVADYAPALQDVATTFYTSEPFYLSQVPTDATSIDVSVDGVPAAPDTWLYDGQVNAVRFTHGYSPVSGASVAIRYQ